MEVKLLTSPQFRNEIQASFRNLADQEKQMKEWMNPSSPHPYWDHLKFWVLDTIYNMHDLDEKCYEYIGEIFYDEEEAKAVQDFCAFFFELLYDPGECSPNSAYLQHPEWPKVWEGAKKIYDMIEENDKKHDILASWKVWNQQ